MGPQPVTGKETRDGSGESCLRESRGVRGLSGRRPKRGLGEGGSRRHSMRRLPGVMRPCDTIQAACKIL